MFHPYGVAVCYPVTSQQRRLMRHASITHEYVEKGKKGRGFADIDRQWSRNEGSWQGILSWLIFLFFQFIVFDCVKSSTDALWKRGGWSMHWAERNRCFHFRIHQHISRWKKM